MQTQPSATTMQWHEVPGARVMLAPKLDLTFTLLQSGAVRAGAIFVHGRPLVLLPAAQA